MFGTKQDNSTALDLPSKTFLGVHFVLLGFDPIDAQKVRSKLVSGGGVDVGQYGSNCTHVLVDNLLYDEPICVTARKDGKILVTGLWVDHSFDIGMPVDPTSVMYIPLRNLDGIPGAKSLVVCLTGYQGQDRDDIMTMVRLMGANFSKPLVANKVTHLICYKFEGEKYELAKKMKKIKLVNHRWLEDCLRDWEILSESNYNKSGYELEMMESEAKDSDEEDAAQETDTKESGRKICASPYMMTVRTNTTPKSKENFLKTLQPKSASKDFPNICNTDGTVLASAEESLFTRALNFENINKQDPEVVGCRDPVIPPHVTNDKSYNKTPTSAKVGSNMATHSDKSSTKSYSRKTPSSNLLSVSAGEIGSNLSSSPKVDVNNFNVRDGFEKPSSRESKGGTDSEKLVRTPTEEGSRLLSGKRKMDRSYGNSKSQKFNDDAKACISECPSVTNVNGCSSSSVSVNASLDKNASPSFRCITPDNIAASDILNSDKKSFPKTVEPQPSFSGSRMGSTIETGIVDVINREEDVILDSLIPQRELHNVQVPSPKTESLVIPKSSSPRSDMFKEKDGDSLSKPLRKKSVAKKTLGSRPKLGLGNAQEKGSIYLNETFPRSKSVSASTVRTCDYEKDEMIPSNVNVNKAMEVGKNNVELSKNKDENKTGSMDDETEAPEDREENELLAVSVEEKTEELGKTNKMNFVMKNKSEGMICSTIKAYGIHLSMREGTSTSCADKDGGESEKRVGKKNELVESTANEDCEYAKSAKLKKSLFGKTLKEPTKSDTGKRKSREGVSRKEVNNKKPNKKMGSGPSPTCNMKKSVPLNRPDNCTEVEKENRPVGIGDQNVSKQIAKCKKMPVKIGPKPGVTDQGSVLPGSIFNLRVELIWFILSGHKLQRKEFQHVIKRLSGRVCRDSHQWSYQATHFIVPDPIRRTEKFFAAAASGRWILKTDYLAASNQAGRFLAEEPYEWHQKGLTEDGAINLEAPRKWRLLRDRTGHGAFYGMRVIIYGECIAPPLDTLKRVIKAGDGTILATSPPYTRFLNSGVDFAIVSPGMPRIDKWVQEFLRHEIPCIVADYLVEYVCKPGYSLEKYVQYNTRAWAERSFANLQARSEEVLEKTVPEDLVTDDIPCQVCGSRERGEVMLICGDESGTRGCGFGTHIDCCNPPLESVPQEDWFCTKCSERKNS